MNEVEQSAQRRSTNLFSITMRKFFEFFGYLGAMFILYAFITKITGEVWPLLERWAQPLSSFFTLLGGLITAISVYFYSPHPHPPQKFSLYVSAPVVIITSAIAIGSLLLYGTVSPIVVNGFAMMAISGALLRIQPYTVED